jgi:membrane protease YdiL (CAAX protease family)
MVEILQRMRDDASRLDRNAVFAFIYACIGLTCIAYLKNPGYLNWIVSGTRLDWIGEAGTFGKGSNIVGLVWWVLISVTFYFVIPAFVVSVIQRRNLAEIALKFSIEDGFTKLFLLCLAIMLPLVYLMSSTGSFSAKYPFLQIYNGEPYMGTTLLIWELVYFAQFFGLEFFFRGFLLHSLKPALGLYSIFAMTVPYTMIHFGKPMAETFAAIFAGVFLGWLSYKNGSIWLGLILHCCVAFSMDVLALYNKGLLF